MDVEGVGAGGVGVGAGGVGVGVGVGAGVLLSVHCCDLAALSQLAISIVLPSTLMLPVLSKQRPEAVLRMVLLELSTHFWLALVEQLLTTTCVPLVLRCRYVSRHLPWVWIVPLEASIHCWPVAVLQVRIIAGLLLAVELFLFVKHLPAGLVSVPAVAAVAAVVMLAAAAPAKTTKAAANFVRALKRFKNLDRVFAGLVLCVRYCLFIASFIG